MVAGGDRAGVLFVVQRTDCEGFRAHDEHDPKFAAALEQAAAADVELVYSAKMSESAIEIDRALSWAR